MKVEVKSGLTLVAHCDAKPGAYCVKETNNGSVGVDTLAIVPKDGACKSLFVWDKTNACWKFWERGTVLDIKMARIKKLTFKPRHQIVVCPAIQSPFEDTEVIFDVAKETRLAENGIGYHPTYGLCIVQSGRFYRSNNKEGAVVVNDWAMLDINADF